MQPTTADPVTAEPLPPPDVINPPGGGPSPVAPAPPTDAVSPPAPGPVRVLVGGLLWGLFLGGLVLVLGGSAFWAWAVGGATAAGRAVLGLRRLRLQDPPEGHGAVDEEGRPHGAWTWYYRDGGRKQETHFVHGDKHGPETYWHPGGGPALEAVHAGGALDGALTQWHANGQKASEEHFVKGVRHGPYASRDAEGRPVLQVSFTDGREDGPAVTWHPGGQKAAAGDFRAGRQQGLWTFWYPNGPKQAEVTFADGLAHGPWRWWYADGRPWVEAGQVHGTLQGPWTEWAADGRLRLQTHFAGGVPLTRGFHRSRDPQQAPAGPAAYVFWGIVLAAVGVAFVREVTLVLGLLVFLAALTIHECGHFAMAKLVGIPVQRFRIGVGPPLGRFLFGSTRYELCLIPLLGFVQPYVLRRAELAHYHAARRARRRGEPLPPGPEVNPAEEQRPASDLVARPQRLLFLLGGVGFNFLAAVLLTWSGATPFIPGRPLERPAGGGPWAATQEVVGLCGQILGIVPAALVESFRPKNYTTYEPSAVAAIGKSVTQAREVARLHGTPTARAAWRVLGWQLMLLNVILLCLNLLPVPPLDGYRCLRVTVEMVLRRDLPERYLAPLVLLGVLFLLLLMLSGLYFLARDVVMAIFR
jgi:antitoxin component YwqK of YwqJK toxin-antitoxin module/membrane-associated protease RseP (regulator of RpoE activity)